MPNRTAIWLGVLIAVVDVAGCGGSRHTSAAASKHAAAQLNVGNTINYGSFGTTAEVDCADGRSLNVGGSNNKLTVTGTCESVNIVGADNTITLREVDDSLTLAGLNNTVTYRRGDPHVDDYGSGNTVYKR